jgi:hypothetical protein
VLREYERQNWSDAAVERTGFGRSFHRGILLLVAPGFHKKRSKS